MNKILNKFVLTRDKFMPDLYLKQPEFTYSACGPFRETGSLKYLYRNELDKACFAHDAACSDSTDLAKRTIPGKILKDRVIKLLEIKNMIDIKEH